MWLPEYIKNFQAIGQGEWQSEGIIELIWLILH